ncbi:MAG: ABC transporter permease subunit [Bacilli bacterium]|nr:ABC transporter permease subunit [Bacilli bacterium]MDD4795014.1 ABC transporter permease subunit [Bacilli bacterium]
MINLPLFKQSIKSNYKLVLIFLAVLTLYIAIIVSMYEPEALKMMESFAETMPELMAMFGMNMEVATLTGFLITYLYGFLFLIMPLIVTIIVANRLIAAHVDKGSMACLLSSPNKRKTIILTQMQVLNLIIFAIIAYSTIITIISSEIVFPGEIEIVKLMLINLSLLTFHIFLGSICFIASTIANETKYSLMFGAGIPLLSFLIQMLANMEGKLDILKYFTLFSFFRPLAILSGEKYPYILLIIMIVITIIIYTVSIKIFKNKDLSI